MASRTHFEVLGLGLKASSPWPWPQVLENCPVLGSRTALFFEQLKFCWKTPETLGKFAITFFVFGYWSIGVIEIEETTKGGGGGRGPAPLQIEISPMTKM